MNMRSEWDSVWTRNDLLSKIIDFGRGIYNIYFVKLLSSHSNRHTQMVEIGCGTSSAIIKLSGKIKKSVGLDISYEALKISAKNAKLKQTKNISFVQGDSLNLPFNTNSFDLVWSQGLIEHLKNKKNAIKEHHRVCKAKGTVLISVPWKYSYVSIWWILTRPRFLRFLWPWTDQEFYTIKKFKNKLRALGINNYKILSNLVLGIIILEIKKD